jgi:hypothetical protein
MPWQGRRGAAAARRRCSISDGPRAAGGAPPPPAPGLPAGSKLPAIPACALSIANHDAAASGRSECKPRAYRHVPFVTQWATVTVGNGQSSPGPAAAGTGRVGAHLGAAGRSQDHPHSSPRTQADMSR